MTNRTMPLRSVDVIGDNFAPNLERVLSFNNGDAHAINSDSQILQARQNQKQNQEFLDREKEKPWFVPAKVSSFGDADSGFEAWREKSSDVDVFITQDKDLLERYYKMRHDVYCIENGWEHYDSSENELDRRGKIIVAMRAGKLVGGIRLLISDWVEYFANEVPGTEYTYRDFLKKFNLKPDAKISEVSAFFVEKGCRNSTISTKLLEIAFLEARRNGCTYNVGISTPALCRSHRRDIVRLGYKVDIYAYPWKPQKSQNYVASCPIVIFFE